MAKCIKCGKKGLFFKVNYAGRCEECEAEYLKQQEEERKIAEEKLRIQQEVRNHQLRDAQEFYDATSKVIKSLPSDKVRETQLSASLIILLKR